MAMRNPMGRVNYEPNSWSADGGPAGVAGDGLPVLPGRRGGPEASASARRRSPTTTARPGSSTSARPTIEQQHIADALVFELSKVETPGDPRADGRRTCATSTTDLADDGRRRARPDGDARAGRPPPGRRVRTCKPSPALSILKNGPKSFAGRKVGALVTDGVDADAPRGAAARR